MPTELLARRERRSGLALARRLVEGVGTGPLIEHVKLLALHVRRQVAPSELSGLDPAWLAIAPVDMG